MKVTDKITITNEDCMELMARYPDNYFDLAIVDPPYGMVGNVFQLKTKKFLNKGETSARMDDVNKLGISLGKPPTQEYFDELFRVSKNQIIFGMQYFINFLPPHQCVIVWDKVNGGSYFSDAEIAWTSFDTAVRLARIHNPSNNRIHPTQKTVKLYKWILDSYAKPTDRILDTHLGSGSIVIACHDYKFDITACELNKDYFDSAIKKIKQHQTQQCIEI